MYPKNYVKQILLGSFLAFLLGFGLLFGYTAWLEFGPVEPTYPPWNMESGTTLSQEFANRGTDLFSISMDIHYNDPAASCRTGYDGETFDFCTVYYPLINTSTSSYYSLTSFFTNNTLEWHVIYANESASNHHRLRSLTLVNLTNAIEDDAKSLDNIKELSTSEGEQYFENELFKINSIRLSLSIIYQDGSLARMEIFDDRRSEAGDGTINVLFTLKSYSSYYGGYYDDPDSELRSEHGVDGATDETYYLAKLNGELMPNLLSSAGWFIENVSSV